LTVRPIIVPDDFVFHAIVDSQNGEAMITADGQVDVRLRAPFEITIKKADFPIKLIKRKDISYYEVLRSKLMWGKDLRII
jgi:NAD+ kinase